MSTDVLDVMYASGMEDKAYQLGNSPALDVGLAALRSSRTLANGQHSRKRATCQDIGALCCLPKAAVGKLTNTTPVINVVINRNRQIKAITTEKRNHFVIRVSSIKALKV